MQVLDRAEVDKAGMMEQLKREITITKHLCHPSIVDLKEVMATRDKIYVVLELVPGGELFDKIIADGPLSVRHLHDHMDVMKRNHRLIMQNAYFQSRPTH
jgi:serine/threonine protein kinase